MATCGCGKKLRSDNKRGLCSACYSRSPQRRADSQKYAEQDRARARAWNAANPGRARDNERKYREAHPEQVKAQQKAWRKANPHRMNEATLAYEARKRGLFVERVDKAVVWGRDGGICHLCGLPADPADWDLEHVISLLEGGPHCYDNAAVSHPKCNNGKRGASQSLCGVVWARAKSAYEQFHDKEYK